MRAFARFFAVLVLALVGGPVWPSPCFAETAFTVSMPRPETHLLEIEMAVAPFPALVRSFELVMPAWAPGSYFIRDFARNVRDDFHITTFRMMGEMNVAGGLRGFGRMGADFWSVLKDRRGRTVGRGGP